MPDPDKKPSSETEEKELEKDAEDQEKKPDLEQSSSSPGSASDPSKKEKEAEESSPGKLQAEAKEKPEPRASGIDIKAKQSIIAETVSIYETAGGGRTVAPLKELLPKHFDLNDAEKLDGFSINLVYRPSEIEELAEALEKQHFVVLTARAKYGKASLALAIAALLCHKEEGPGRCYSLGGPERDLRIDLFRFGEVEDYRNSVILIKDAIDYNRDLNAFLSGFNSFRLGSLQSRLKSNRAFVMLTCDVEKLGAIEPKLREAGVLLKLQEMDAELLLAGVEKRARQLLRSGKVDIEDADNKVEEFLDDKDLMGVIIKKLETMPNICRFIDDFFVEVLKDKSKLEEALHKAASLEDWFLTDLAEDDFEAWCCCLALVLAQASGSSEGARWVQFEALRNSLRDYLEQGRTPDEKRDIKAEDAMTARYVPRRDDYYLDKIRSEIQRDPYLGADLIRFKDPSYPDSLWHLLLRKARNLVGYLLPFLKEQTKRGDLYQKMVGAMSLGRIGELDTSYLALPLIYEWGQSENKLDHYLLGAFFQGVLGSQFNGESEDYRSSCLNSLRHLLLGGNVTSAWAAQVCLREIGLKDLNVAMREMRSALLKKFGKKIEDERLINERLVDFDPSYYVFDHLVFEELSGWHPGNLDSPLLTDNEFEFLAATRYLLAGLCFGLDPMEVISHLLEWMTEEEKEEKKVLAPLVALLFLGNGGVADTVEQYKVQTNLRSTAPSQEVKCGRMLLSLSITGSAPKCMASFLERLYEGSKIFPGLFGIEVRKGVFQLLTKWAKEAVLIPQCRQAMKALFRHLMVSSNSDLKDQTRSLLTQSAEFNKRGSELNKFARDVRLYEPDNT